MRIRSYIPSKDYQYISKWIDDERTHAFWCANLLPYPITQQSFHDFLEKNAIDWSDSAYIVTENSGQAIGFFCYSINTTNNIGFLKMVIVDNAKRGKGYGKKLLDLALQYAFQITGANAVQLNVFNETHQQNDVMKKLALLKEMLIEMCFHIKTNFGADAA